MSKLLFGCGYLGRRVAAAWHRAGDEVHVVTRSAERATEFRSHGWIAHVADICEPSTLSTLPAVGTVLFCVGYDRHSNRSREAVMVDGVANVLAHYRNRCERFIYTSSTSVYGQHNSEWVDETSPCEPTQPGGECCLAAEQLIAASFGVREDALSVAPPFLGGVRGGSFSFLRLAGLYGPNRFLARIESLQRGDPIAGRPDAWLNLIHIDDAVAAILACEQRSSPGETYLVCDNEPIPRSSYFSLLAELVHAPPPRFDEAQPSARGSGGLNKRCSNRKLRDQLGVELRYPSIREGLPAALAAP